MALTAFQRELCRLLADQRVRSGESYVAGGAALNELVGAARLSQDIDVFHDTDDAVTSAWLADRQILTQHGVEVVDVRQYPTLVEAEARRGTERTVIQWARDSAFRFFPLIQHPDFGLTLHPLDLATNKVLALVGRVEARDWVDTIECCEHIQPLGYLAWAACGKDPGFSPSSIIEYAARMTRYSAAEIDELAYVGAAPDAAALARNWKAMVREARDVIAALPMDRAGSCVLDERGKLFRGSAAAAAEHARRGALRFHTGTLRGAFPHFVDRG